ncbi:unnamed protein product [Rhizoctonia solani]|uniref:NACHT domain-containing protein n=1 Tax=Rhizoctonia solani TaxID=456999 RepID=A0A8H3GWV5_9AGAM|nr:unnamed protein product [Rhizoctonia solani]
MSSRTGASTPKKGFRDSLRGVFVRSSSHLATSLTSSPQTGARSSFSAGAPNKADALNAAPTSRPLNSEQIAAPHSQSAPSAISTGAANPQPGLPPTENQDDLDTTETNSMVTNMVWAGLKSSLQGLRDHSGVFPGLSMVAGILLECFDGIETAARNQEDYEDLARELTTLSESLAEYVNAPTPPSVTKCISSITSEMKQQAEEVKNKKTRGEGGRLLVAKADEEDVIRRYRRIQSLFRQLQANLSMSAWSIAHEHLVNTRLEALKPVEAATFDSALSSTVNRRKCTEGTRTQILSNLDNWLVDSDMPTVYWMNGMAGTGKTTIACTFSERLEHRERLAASFFCTRASVDCRDVVRIVPTIAYQLARYSIPFQSALYEILGKEPNAGSKHAEKQFERLLRDPLQKAKDAMPDNLVVVIDALDECSDHAGVETILDMLLRYAKDLPLRFFVTSRPEPEIYNRMMLDVNPRVALHLHDIESSLVQADIELYLKEELSFMSPSPSEIEQLAQRSGSLFIYAATLVRYIRFGKRFVDPQQRLQSVLSLTPESSKKHAEIDALYTAILQSALEEAQMEEHEAEDVKLVLRTVLFAQEPISVETIAALAGLDNPQRVHFALQPLRSVLHQSEDTKLVSTLHASFPDFMLSSDRSKSFFCDIVDHSQRLAERCLAVMKEQLVFNICKLESSFVPDDKVGDIKDRIIESISPTLAHACHYWANHVTLALHSDALLRMLEEFVCERLLFWMEVLNLRRKMVSGVEALLKAKKWLNQAGSTSSELAVLLEDACNFITGFAGGPASQSTPHIYVSSLPLCPRSSTVYKNYWKRTRGLLELKGSLMERREGAALAIWNIGSSVRSVTYSPDGTRVAVGCTNKTVRILNAHDGTSLLDPLQGHTNTVYSVAFSPDGKLVASGSGGGTIRVWNAYNGILMASPLEAHTSLVISVTFSPDFTRIISASYDDSIRIWDVNTGNLVADPWSNPSNDICATALSPDGTLLACTSRNYAITLWNLSDMTCSTPSLQGHAMSVHSITFTPDGARLVSGSDDQTIRIWNTSDGSLSTNPFEGHTDTVNSVTVSTDGTQVASGSDDHTVRVWKIDDGTLISGPLIGHTSGIQSVAFSPDGTRVISGSGDGTIRVWSVRNGIFSSPTPYEAHMSSLQSVLLLANGTRIVSGSHDSSIWAWDITHGEVVVSPLGVESHCFATTVPVVSGSYLPVFSTDYSVNVLNIADGSLVAESLYGHTAEIVSFGFSADNTHFATGSRDRTVRLWDLRRAKPIGMPFRGHEGTVTYVALSPDSSRVVSCSTQDLTIRVWNTTNTLLPAPLPLESFSETSSNTSSSPVLEGWELKEDGWVRNSSSALLFWIPHDLASLYAWPSPHAEFIITKYGVLHIVQKELYIGDSWSQCYITD